jgi:WD40 repeat protein
VQSQFEYLIWRSLQHAPPIDELLANFIQFLSNGQDTEVTLPLDLDSRILRLVDYLRKHRCLLILDNAESVLPCNSVLQDPDSSSLVAPAPGYSELLERLSDLPHESCLILTSREKSEAIAWKEGVNLPVRSLQLSGLSETDVQKLFALKGAFQASPAEWQTLIQHYAGNPLALKMMAAAIQELFNGNISEFLSVLGTFVFDDIRDLLDRQFNRLSDVEKEVMYWLAINREVTSFIELRDDLLSPISQQKLPSTLRSLKHRFLIETNANGFTQQPVVMEYVTNRLVEQVCQEIGERHEASGIHAVSPQEWGQGATGEGDSSIAYRLSPLALFHTHALLKADAKDYIRESQTRLFLEPIAHRLLLAMRSPKHIEQQAKALLAELRSQPQNIAGYAAGNIINLLRHLKINLAGSDFSDLIISQAYLQGVDLHGVNFGNSNLSRSVFNESLGNVWSVVFSPDGQFLAVSDSNGEIHLWRMADYKKVLTFRGHRNWVCALAFSPDGRVLASSSADSSLKLWRVATGKCLHTLQGHSDWIVAVAYSSDGTLLASSGIDSASIRVWQVETGVCLRTLEGHSDWVCAIAFAPSSAGEPAARILASGSDDYNVKLWNADTSECLHTLQGHTSNVRSVTFAPASTAFSLPGAVGKILASSSDDHTIKFWDTTTGQCLRTLSGHGNNVRSVAFNPDGQTLISASEDRTLKLWDVKTGQCLKTFYGHTAHVRTVAFAPTGNPFNQAEDAAETENLMETASPSRLIASGGADQTVRLWDSNTGRCLKTLQGYASFMLSVAFAPGGMLASSSADHTIKLWDVTSCQCLNILRGHSHWVWSVAFSPNGKTLASGSFDRTVRLWDVETGQCQKILHKHSHWVWSVAFSADGKILASSGADRSIHLWESATGEWLQTLDCQENQALSVAFSPVSDRLLASGDTNSTVKLWDISRGECVQVLQGHTSRVTAVIFSSDGNWLISSSADRTIKVWDVQTGCCLKTLTGHTEPVECIALQAELPAVAEDGKPLPGHNFRLFSGSADHTVKQWNLTTGKCVRTLEDHERRVWAIASHPSPGTNGISGSCLLASGSEDETVRLWNPETGTSTTLRSPRP